MESLHRLPKLQMVYFFTAGRSLVVVSSVHRMTSYFHAIAMWRNSNTPRPKFHEHKKLTKMLVVKDIFKPSFGRPSSFARIKKALLVWQWGDVIRPQCYHGMQCSMRKVKKDGAKDGDGNYGHLFYTCWKGKDDSCGYFEWRDKKEDEDPFEPFSTAYFSNPPSYEYTVKETGEKFTSHHENRSEAYQEYLSLKSKEENL